MTNPKLQAPNPNTLPNANDQDGLGSGIGAWDLELGAWDLELGIWSLGFGAWDLELGI
jgi:hypothetical protein